MTSPSPPLPSGRTALAGVLGDPVRHSLSPAMHNAALREMGLDWVYLALPVAAPHLATVLEALEALDCRGLNVTIPHKQAAATLASERSPLAARLGAANTLVRRQGGGWHATNTDVEGFLAPLLPKGGAAGGREAWQGRRALVLGCGGSARAVLAGLAELGLGTIAVLGRRREAVADLLSICGPWAAGVQGWQRREAAALALEGGGSVPLADLVADADLVVNTTPVGMAGGPGEVDSPLDEPLLAALRSSCVVYDLIYTPRPTALLRASAARGCPTLDGLEMLVQQGAASLRLWSGREDVPVAAMRRAALEHLGGP